MNTTRETGYRCDLALKKLMELFAQNSGFASDLYHLYSLPRFSAYIQKKLEEGKRKDAILPALINNGNNYKWLTKEWRKEWNILLKNISENEKKEFETVAEKWGLRCDCGCGFISSEIPIAYPFNFILTPGPPILPRRLSIEIGVQDTKYSINEKLHNLKDRSRKSLKAMVDELEVSDYQGFGKENKKDLTRPIEWLFWHITPPYLSAKEISLIEYERGGCGGEYYIQTCYQEMAKLLHIKMLKGWTKGRKRNSDARSKIRRDKIEAKIAPKNF